jgi:hypothetical protein
MKKEIHVLGLGPGIENYSNIDNIPAVGVNNIWDYYRADYVVCIDKIEAFSPERFKTILNCDPLFFFTCWQEWIIVRKDSRRSSILIELDNLLPGRGGLLDHLDSDDNIYPFHVDSTFTATCLAYRIIKDITGPGRIIMFGCRFHGHHQLKNILTAIRECYSRLYQELLKRNITLYNADKQSALYDILPFYQ